MVPRWPAELCLAPFLFLGAASTNFWPRLQFNWEDVKEDKQGQNYLGHSVQAAHGRSRASTRFLSLCHSLLFHWLSLGQLRVICYQSRITSTVFDRWQKNKDLNWAWKKSKLDLKAANKTELQMAKERDADLMAQMLSAPALSHPSPAACVHPFPNLVSTLFARITSPA